MAESRTHRPVAVPGERRKPFLIRAAPPFLALWGGLGLLLMLIMVLGGGPAGGAAGGRELPRWELLALALPVAAGWLVLQLAGAWGLLMERPWARDALTTWSLAAFLVGVLLMSLGTARAPELARAAWPQAVLWFGALFWYFHRYGPVRRYYAALAERQAPAASPSPVESSP
jgi:hypothetical protein